MKTEMAKTRFQKPTEKSAIVLCVFTQTPPTPAETIFKTSIFTFFEDKHNMVQDEFHTEV